MSVRLGLFGGTFDPPHVAHLAVAEAAREQARLDEVRWLPASVSPFKTEALATPAEHRLAMARLAVEGNPAFAVDDRELRRGGVSYTVDTVRALAEEHPDAELFLLLGGDSLAGFPQWREPEAILERARLLVYRRPADAVELAALPAAWYERLLVIEGPGLAVASSALRAQRAAGRSVRYLVPEAVRAYIDAHGLYAGEPAAR